LQNRILYNGCLTHEIYGRWGILLNKKSKNSPFASQKSLFTEVILFNLDVKKLFFVKNKKIFLGASLR